PFVVCCFNRRVFRTTLSFPLAPSQSLAVRLCDKRLEKWPKFSQIAAKMREKQLEYDLFKSSEKPPVPFYCPRKSTRSLQWLRFFSKRSDRTETFRQSLKQIGTFASFTSSELMERISACAPSGCAVTLRHLVR